jgi:O-antigen/teichoic acid export membrane protein
MNHTFFSSAKTNRSFRSWFAAGQIGIFSAILNRAGELGWVMAGKFGLMGANAVLMLFLANRLELSTYGLLVLTISAQLLISRLIMMGVDVGMIRLTGTAELAPRSREILTAGFVVMSVGSTIFLILASLLALPPFKFGVPGWVMASAVAGAIGTSLVDYGYSFRLARREYPLAAVAQGGTALGRFVLTVISVLVFPAYSLAVFIAYHGASLLSGLLQTAVIAKGGPLKTDQSLIRRLLRYSFWQGKANVIVIFSLYQGTFLLMLLRQPTATGIFGLGLTLSLGFFAIYNAYGDYLLARVASVKDAAELPQFIRRAFGASVALVLACIPAIFVIALLIPRILRPDLWQVVPIFCYLAASMALLILQCPLEAACHYYLRPHLVSFGWVLRAVSIGVAGLVLAPGLGARGAAIGQLVGAVFSVMGFAVMVALMVRSVLVAELQQPGEIG